MNPQLELNPWSCEIDHDPNNLTTVDTDWKNKGYRMAGISGYGPTDPLFCAVWDNKNGHDYTFKTNMNPAEFQQQFDTFNNDGWTLNWIDGYEFNNEVKYAAIWERKESPESFTRQGLTTTQFQTNCEEFAEKGFRPVHVSGWCTNGISLYAAIWRKDTGPETEVMCDMTLSAFEQCNTDFLAKGFMLVSLNGWTCNKEQSLQQYGKKEMV